MVLAGHTGGVNAVCAFTLDDRTVRIWEPGIGSCLAVVNVHYEASAVTWDGVRLAIALSAGLLAIRPLPPLLDF